MNGLIPNYFNGDLEGDILIDGLDSKTHAIGELATRIGTVFQEPDSQLFFQTVEDDIAFGPENLCVPTAEIASTVEEILVKTKLTPLRFKSPNNLSEGQKQLVAVASVLAMKPKIMLLDEPTSNLDSESGERIIKLVKMLNHEGMTVILATHEIDLLASCADRIVILNNGQIEASGSPAEIFSKPEFFWKLGLIPPQLTQLVQKLKINGFDLGKTPSTPEELFEQIVRRLDA
jgi:energy-coupling factor transporter ATP-binding protein EcfA2